MRVILLLVAAAVFLPGCTTMTTTETVLVADGASSGTIRLDFPPASAMAPRDLPTRVNDTLDVTLADGSNATAQKVYVREIVSRDSRGRTVARAPCGGALLVTPDGAPDALRRFDLLTYADSTRAEDPNHRSWTTDRYTQGDNATLSVWVVNLGGDPFRADDGRQNCDPLWYAGRAYNAVAYTGLPVAQTRFSPDARPAEPAERAWVDGNGNALPAATHEDAS